MNIIIRATKAEDIQWINDLIRKEFGSEIVVVHGKVYKPGELSGFIAEEDNQRVGLLTYEIINQECEIITLNSIRQNKGVGTLLVHKLLEVVKLENCKRIWLITTNDNLNALKFYQKRGYQIITVYPNALEKSRRIKPQIPLIGKNEIPLRDEIELEQKII